MRAAALMATMGMVVAGGCGGSSSAPSVPDGALDLTGQAAVEIEIVDNAFEPRIVVVTEGTDVTWVNTGRNDHDVLPNTVDAFPVVTPVLHTGESATRTFATVGEYKYFCSLHGFRDQTIGQNGTIIVLPAE